MSLSDLIRGKVTGGFATATVATVATVDPHLPLTVANVATVAVATAPAETADDANWTALEAAITRCCMVRGDPTGNLEALLADCWQEPADTWSGWCGYFNAEAERFTVPLRWISISRSEHVAHPFVIHKTLLPDGAVFNVYRLGRHLGRRSTLADAKAMAAGHVES